MTVGDPSAWAERFRSLDTRLLGRIVALWPCCIALLPPQPEEDKITLNLMEILRKDNEVRRLVYYIEFHFEPVGYLPTGTAYSKGQIDLAILLTQDREKYLAYECKRLNVLSNAGIRSSLATRYVKEGVMRFVTEQYADDLPVGCMLGYVMDGDTTFARTKVHAALAANIAEIKLLAGPSDTDSIGQAACFSTEHNRRSKSHEIEIRHSLLPFPVVPSNGDEGS